ncbi:MAG: hypothetical protein R3F59_02710 [Myxococcota bacterium]
MISRLSIAVSAALLGACTGPEAGVFLHDTGADLVDPTGPTVVTLPDTGTTSTRPDQTTACMGVPELDATTTAETTIDEGAWLPAGMDFDFDIDGRVITSMGNDLVRFGADGSAELFLPGVGYVWGVRSLPTGEIAVARPGFGMTALVSDEAPPRPVIGGLLNPLALEVGLDGTVYAADATDDGHIWMVDPQGGAAALVAILPYPTGLALSPDDETLYVATYGNHGSHIAAIDRVDGVWDPASARVVLAANDQIYAMTTDVCGNLYYGELGGSVIQRVRFDDGDPRIEPVADLSPAQSLTALRFGTGVGGFAADRLYASAGGSLFGVTVGVDGRHVLSAR